MGACVGWCRNRQHLVNPSLASSGNVSRPDFSPGADFGRAVLFLCLCVCGFRQRPNKKLTATGRGFFVVGVAQQENKYGRPRPVA